MAKIQVLDKHTIDKIAAGEVIERPSSVVKELTENAVDAGASSVTVEIRDGGTTFLRVTDNGCGIEPEQVADAFLRHSTSKIRKVEDLAHISSLGFRGEALSSIASVAQVELITKTAAHDTGIVYRIEGGEEKSLEETGAPEGTTFLIRNLFYNVPARRKFLKSPMTEAGYIGTLMERLALSHPDISFKLIVNHQTKLQTSGNTNLKDIIYHIYGRDVASELLQVTRRGRCVDVTGYIGKPVVSRGNRNYENYFVNGRYVKNPVITRAIEDAYKSFMMQHRYPFTALLLQVDGEKVDVNVHPAKLEVRFSDNDAVYQDVFQAVHDALAGKEFIPEIVLTKEEEQMFVPPTPDAVRLPQMPKAELPSKPSMVKETAAYMPRQAEKEQQPPQPESPLPAPAQSAPEDARERNLAYFMEKMKERVTRELASAPPADAKAAVSTQTSDAKPAVSVPSSDTKPAVQAPLSAPAAPSDADIPTPAVSETSPVQLDLFEHRFLDQKSRAGYRLIGQLFDTYWLVEFEDKLYIIDQHAAHEKVLYERTMRSLRTKEYTSQLLSPPVILTLNMQEEELLRTYMDEFTALGFEIEAFGGREYAVRAVPDNLFSVASREVLTELLDGLRAGGGSHMQSESIHDRIATMSCKAAVKGNHHLSAREAEALIEELLNLENPYNCPHGRPTIVSMSQYELEKKFKRIV